MKVIVVGAGITGLTAAFRVLEHGGRTGTAIELTVLEAEARAGGHARTLYDSEFIVETGPNGFLDRAHDSRPLDLARRLGLESRLRESQPAARRRFVYHRGRLRRVPSSPPSFISSDALSLRAKLRLLIEPWARAAEAGVEESVFEFARRRLGREAAEVLVDTAVSGVSAGDSRRLSMASAFPLMLEMERESGSLIRAMIARRGQRRTRLVAFDGGMQTLVAELCARLGGGLRTSCAVRAISRTASQWRLSLADGSTLEADRLVLSVSAARAAVLLQGFDHALAQALGAIPFAGLAMVALAFRQTDTGPLEGYGYLVSRDEGLDTLGVVWESSLFQGRAPRGTVLLRVMLGGALRPDVVARSESGLIESARREVAKVMGVSAAPQKTWVRRFPGAIAQYEVGHAGRVERVRSLAATHPGLVLCGTSYDGISFTSAVASAADAASRVTHDFIRPTAEASQVESPYAAAGKTRVCA